MPGKRLQKVAIETENGDKCYSLCYKEGIHVDTQAHNGEIISSGE